MAANVSNMDQFDDDDNNTLNILESRDTYSLINKLKKDKIKYNLIFDFDSDENVWYTLKLKFDNPEVAVYVKMKYL